MDYFKERCLVTEAGLTRLLKRIEDRNFSIITAYRDEYDKKENIKRNRKLRGELNQRKMGIYPLIGHWRECKNKEIKYKDCPEDQLKDVIERSYLVVCPDDMKFVDFKKLIVKLTKEYEQDASLIAQNGKYYNIENDGEMSKIGDKMNLYKISQAYSQYIKKQDIPFVFEALLPCNNMGRQLWGTIGLSYPKVNNKNEINIIEDVIN